MFKLYKEDVDNYNTYYDETILDSGQSIRIEFNEDANDKECYYYNIYLVISNKKKSRDNTYLKQTGKDGVKGLLWAKRKIIEFEEFIKEEHKESSIMICTRWDDNRRRNVYERGLRDIGYKFNMVFGQKQLCKKIN